MTAKVGHEISTNSLSLMPNFFWILYTNRRWRRVIPKGKTTNNTNLTVSFPEQPGKPVPES